MTSSSGEASASSRWRYEGFEIVVMRQSSQSAPSRSSRPHCKCDCGKNRPRPVSSIVTVTHPRVSAAVAHHSGLLRFSVNEENMMLKLILISLLITRVRIDGVLQVGRKHEH